MKRQLLFCSLATVGLLALASSGQAAVISFNIDTSGTIGTVGADFRSGANDIAGVVPAGYWTGTWNGSFAQFAHSDMIDSDGNLSTIDMTAVGFNQYSVQGHPGQDSDGTWNNEMINGYINAGASVSPAVTTVEISDIRAATYDIIAYFNSDVAGRTGTVSDGTTTYDFSAVGPDSVNPGGTALLIETTSTDGVSFPRADYAVFSGLTGSSQTITVDIPDFGGIAAIQVIVPEPASVAMCSLLGMVGLAGWLRTRWG